MVRRRTGDVVARLEFGRRQPKSERQLFVEAQGSSKGQAFSAIACTLQSMPQVLALFTPWHVLGQKSLYRNLNAPHSASLDSRIAKAP